MNFSQAITSGFKRYVDFQGRSSRSEYWFWILFYYLAFFAIEIVAGVTMGISGPGTAGAGIFAGFMYLGFFGAIVLPSFAVLVRRLHDTNRSGWWCLLSMTIIGAIPVLIWLCTAGTIGENRFGPDPLNLGHANTATVNVWES